MAWNLFFKELKQNRTIFLVWAASIALWAILVMSVFGLCTTPLWPTYIPAVAATPFIMRRVAGSEHFRSWPLPIVLGISFLVGILAGIGVISIMLPWQESLDLVLNWVAAGGVSGGVTLAIISAIFRYEPRAAKPRGGALDAIRSTPPVLPRHSALPLRLDGC